jgi:hypothetical protein
MALGENDGTGICLQSFNHCIEHGNHSSNFRAIARIFTILIIYQFVPGCNPFFGTFLPGADGKNWLCPFEILWIVMKNN